MRATANTILWAVVMFAVVATIFVYGQVGVATQSIQFDLKKIGESVYEAHSKTGSWPRGVADLEGTVYLSMPERRRLLDEQRFVVIWPENFANEPSANRDRILAYDNGSLLARFGWIWVCRGDLRLEMVSADELNRLR